VTKAADSLPRRAVLKISLALSGLLALGGLARFLSYRQPPPASQRVPVGSPNDYTVGSVTAVPQARAWLIRDELGFYAVSGLCTHLGCTVTEESDEFACPCHGSRFRHDGLIVKGPALRPLPHLQVNLTEDHLLILDAASIVTDSQRLTIGA